MGLTNEVSADTAEWTNYRRAFETFRNRARIVQQIASDPHVDRARVDAALVEAEKARAEYNHARDTLVAKLLPGDYVSGVDGMRTSSDIREVAVLLWDLRGRPQGSAEEDWYRAEDILRRAAAVSG